MKHRIITAFVVISLLNLPCLGQDTFTNSRNDEPLVLGETATFTIAKMSANVNGESIDFFETIDFSFKIDDKDIEVIDQKLQNNNLVVTMKLPLNPVLIDVNKEILIIDSQSRIIGKTFVNVNGKDPQFEQLDRVEFFTTDRGFRFQEIKGKNLEVLNSFAPASSLETKLTNEFGRGSDKININIRPIKGTPSIDGITFNYTYNKLEKSAAGTWSLKQNETGSVQLDIAINVPPISNDIDIEPGRIVIDDLRNLRKFDLQVKVGSRTSNEGVTVKSPDADNGLGIDLHSTSFLTAADKKGVTRITKVKQARVSLGVKTFEIKRATAATSDKVHIEVVDTPTINFLVGENSDLEFDLLSNSYQTLEVRGSNLNGTEVILENDFDGVISLTEVTELSTNTRKVVRLSILDDSKDKLRIDEYQVGLSRNDLFGEKRVHHFPELKIHLVEPRKTHKLEKFVFIKTNSAETPFDELTPHLIDWNEQFYIHLKGENVPREKGPQAVEIKASLYDENGDIVEVYTFNEGSDANFALVANDDFGFRNSDNSETWDLYDRISAKKFPWAILIVEARHSSPYYQDTREKIHTIRQKIVIKGRTFVDNWNMGVSVPPGLFTIAGGENQLLGFNFGFGAKYEFRNSRKERTGFSFGPYLIGLNFLGQSETRDTTITNVEEVMIGGETVPVTTVVTDEVEEDQVINPRDAGLLFLFEWIAFNRERRLQFPVQLGVGVRFKQGERKAKFIPFILGLGLNFNF